MQHYVSLAGQGLSDRPWASYFGEPSLSVFTGVKPLILKSGSEHATAWGYVCPVVEDSTTGNIIELCFEEWRGPHNGPEWEKERIAHCGSPAGLGHSLDRAITLFASGTRFATENEHYDHTQEVSDKEMAFLGYVSTENLSNVIKADNESCGRGSSLNSSAWALIGIASGVEGAENTQVTEVERALSVQTNYTQLPITVSAESATEISGDQATVTAKINPYGLETNYIVEYGTTTAYGSSTAQASVGSGVIPTAVQSTLTKLLPGITYHYRIHAYHYNEDELDEPTYGSDQTFTTPTELPAAVTDTASSITQTSATLNATVNPNGATVSTCKFEYGTTSSYGSSVSCSALPGSGDSPVAVSAGVGSLGKSTTYHFRIVATNSGGTGYGTDQAFTTPPYPPAVETDAATLIKRTSATLDATVNPEGETVSICKFEYGTTMSYGKSMPCSSLPGSGEGPVAVSAPIGSLSESTTYHFRIVATNPVGTSYGTDRTFMTLPTHPTVETVAASSIEQSSATLNATVNPQGATVSTCRFEYGTSVSYGSSASCVSLPGSGESAVAVSAPATGLTASTTYHYRIVATNTLGTSYGTDRTFETSSASGCEGGNIMGAGSTLQKIAQQTVWDPDFNTSGAVHACNGTQGTKAKPTVTYSATGSGLGLESWGANGHTADYEASNAFISTDEPPDETQIAEIEKHGAVGTLETIPVLQGAVAIVVNLPEGCTATSKSAFSTRLVLDNATLEKIFRGVITKWSEITDAEDKLSGSTCKPETPIKLVVRRDESGTTHILKMYLGQMYVGGFETEQAENRTWEEVSRERKNTIWPEATAVIRPESNGAEALLKKVAETPGSIGYANLADARSNKSFTPPTGGPSKSRFWVPVQNDGRGITGTITYADPSTNGDAEAVANANCAGEEYLLSGEEFPFPPPNVLESWTEVTTKPTQKNYVLCGLTYTLAFTKYSKYVGTTQNEATTVNNFVNFILGTGSEGGQKLIEKHDYLALPEGAVLTEAIKGAENTRF
jgi:ABC-type phosphate transport system substrate-binding protein